MQQDLQAMVAGSRLVLAGRSACLPGLAGTVKLPLVLLNFERSSKLLSERYINDVLKRFLCVCVCVICIQKG